MSDLEDARTLYLAEQPAYQEVANEAKRRLTAALRRSAIAFRVEARAKECHSLLLKMVTKNKKYEEVGDKAGARVILFYPDERVEAASAIEGAFSVVKKEDFLKPSDPTTFSYSGIHFDVKIDRAGASLPCEVQLHTPGESLWANLAHDLTYKDKSAPYQQMRDTHRLRALTELFDLEAMRLRQGLRGLVMAEEREMLRTLNRYYLPLAAEPGRSELSLELLGALKQALRKEDRDRLAPLLADFVEAKHEKLADIYDGMNERAEPFLHQPESLLMFFLIDRDPTCLADVWPARFPRRTPISFAALWGVAPSDPDSLD